MKTKILGKTVVSGFVLLLAASTPDGKELVKMGKALPANIITVTNTNDSGPGSLRDALAIANDGDTIDASGVSGTILLTSGELQINHNVTVNGPGAGNLAVNGNATSRVFHNFASNVTISGFTITNGFTTDQGGGILNEEGLTISDSNIVNNVGGAYGGGITSIIAGALTVTNTVISGNTSTTHGGGIAICCGVTLTVTNSVITGNESSLGGGIHAADSAVTVSDSTINGNTSSNIGGGIALDGFAGFLMVTNSTISGNVAGSGGGIGTNCGCDNVAGSVDGGTYFSLIVTNTTFSGNSASRGGCIFIDDRDLATQQIGDSILNAGASGGTMLIVGISVFTFSSLGYNLASDDGYGVLTGPGDQINTDPMLGPLQDNGGPTFTHALLPGSPAIDAGDPNFMAPPFYDQRGPDFWRVSNGRIDIGSFEVQGTPTPTPTPTATPTPTPKVTPRPSPTPRPRRTPPPRP